MNTNAPQKMTNYRWVICAMLFLATTVNYMDRQVLSLTWKDFIAPEFHWTHSHYGDITAAFSLFYAFISLFSGKFIDWVGTKKGYLIAIFIWSLGACLHAGCGWLTMYIHELESKEVMQAIEAGSTLALAISTTSVWLFMACRIALAIGESGNFPAAIKVTAEYFPKKDRALATSIFNSGASVGALVAPISIPFLAHAYGWELAFIIIGGLGFFWMGFWYFLYEKPEKCKYVNEKELAYVNQDDANAGNTTIAKEEPQEAGIPIWKCFLLRHTWSYICGKFFTDGVWWFLLFWAPAYFSVQYGHRSDSTMGATLIFVVYLIVTIVSIVAGGYLPKFFVERCGMEAYSGRLRAMLIFACLPIFALFAQPLGHYSVWWAAIIIGLAGAGHQSWSANLYSTVGDMFPKGAIATITGIGTMTGGIASFIINKSAGWLFDYTEKLGSDFHFFGFEGLEGGYMIIFCYCAVAYLIAWACMKILVPKYKKVEI